MLPDTGERYLSTPLFDDIGEAMSAEELAISTSTPRLSLRYAAWNARSARAGGRRRRSRGGAVVDAAVRGHPVVLFALEWCEFCWSVRKLFAQLGIDYHKVDLDSVELQRDDLGNKIRAVLAQRTGARTIPQIFIGNEPVGGCTDLFDGWRSGAVQQRLDACHARTTAACRSIHTRCCRSGCSRARPADEHARRGPAGASQHPRRRGRARHRGHDPLCARDGWF